MPSPICKVNNLSTTNGSVTVPTSSTVTVALVVPTGVRTWEISCYGTDETSNKTSITAQLAANKDNNAFTTTFSSGAAGTSLNFKSVINGGIDDDGRTLRPDYTQTFQINTLVNGNKVFSMEENMENDPQFGWIQKINKPIRDGYVGGSGFTAGGDLTGTNSSQTVSKIQGVTITGTAANGRLIVASSSTAAQWSDPSSFAFTAGGDLSGSTTNQNVIKINGATVPASGALTTNHVLKVSGAAATTYGYILDANVDAAAAIAGTKISPNFGGQAVQTTSTVQGASIIVGSSGPTITQGTGAPGTAPVNGSVYLRTDGTNNTGIYLRQAGAWSPVGATATGTAGGDLAGSFPSPTVISITGTAGAISLLGANLGYASTIVSPKFYQLDDATNSITGDAMVIQSQNATGTTSNGGSLTIQTGTGTTAAGQLIFKSGATTVLTVDSSSQITFKNIKFVESGNSKGTNTTNTANVQTTDATVTTVDSGTIPNGTSIVDVMVVAVRSDYTQGATYKRSMTFRNNAGTVAAISTVTDAGTKEDNSAWDCTIDNSTTTWRVRVTGVAATTIQWVSWSSIKSVVP